MGSAGPTGSAAYHVRRVALHHFGVRDFVAWYGEKNRDTTGKTVDIR